jgi:hypothetical protein
MTSPRKRNRLSSPKDEVLEPVLEYLDPKALIPNPRNWRTHGVRQRQAFSDILDEVGMLEPVILNKRTGHLIDGHMRVQEFIERNAETIPVYVVDLPEEKEHLAIYFKDRIGAMAGVDTGIEQELRKIAETEAELLKQMLASGEDSPAEEGQENRNDLDNFGVGLNPGERFSYIIVLFKTDLDFYAGLDHFQLEKERDPLNPYLAARVAQGRVVDGRTYLRRIRNAE